MKLLASLLIVCVVWLAAFSGSAGSGVKRQTSWQAKHQKHQHQRLKVVRAARTLLGVPYVFGGTGRRGVDCSGLTRFAYAKIGKHLPHLAAAQARLGRYVAQRKLRPGDLLLYNNGGHVALYVGKGQMIEASSSRGRVVRTSLREGWNFDQARRLIG